jgi:hypothetical protein
VPHHSQICCFPTCLVRHGFLNAKRRSRRRADARSPRVKEFMINRVAFGHAGRHQTVLGEPPRCVGNLAIRPVDAVRSNRVDTTASRKRHGGDLTPRREGAYSDVSRHLRLCIHGWGFVPTGKHEKVTTCTDGGALRWPATGGSVQSGRPKRSSPRSDRSAGSSEVKTRGPSTVTAGPGRGGRRSCLSGSTNAQHIRGANAPDPKGLP